MTTQLKLLVSLLSLTLLHGSAFALNFDSPKGPVKVIVTNNTNYDVTGSAIQNSKLIQLGSIPPHASVVIPQQLEWQRPEQNLEIFFKNSIDYTIYINPRIFFETRTTHRIDTFGDAMRQGNRVFNNNTTGYNMHITLDGERLQYNILEISAQISTLKEQAAKKAAQSGASVKGLHEDLRSKIEEYR